MGYKKRVVVAVSGTGRSLLNLLSHPQNTSKYEIVGVISSTNACMGAEIAQRNGLPLFVDPFQSEQASPSTQLIHFLTDLRTEWIALAGFIRKFPTQFPVCSPWRGQIVNIHPSLLPKFGGKNMYGDRVHEAVLKAQESMTGATIHLVTPDYDQGAVLARCYVKVAKEDTPATLKARVFEAESILFPLVLNHLSTHSLENLISTPLEIYHQSSA